MNQIAALFYEIGEPFAAGLFEEPEKGYFYRFCLGYARYFEALRPAEWKGEQLYPALKRFYDPACAVRPQFAISYEIDWKKLEEKSVEAAAQLRGFYDICHNPGGWTHAAPNYRRILKEGLSSYRARVMARPEGEEFREGLLALIAGMENYICRSIEYLRSAGAPQRLIRALERVPFEPAATYYEGLVAWNIIFYFDGADNLGCLDSGLIDLYAGEDYTEIIGELYANLDAAETWSVTVGPDYNPITLQALRAIRGRRRPLLELMVTENMPDELWEMAIDHLRAGSSNPAFYNADGIYAMLRKRFPHIPEEEIRLFCGCGCTETNLQGLTRAGGTDENVPLLLIFEKYMYEKLPSAGSFEQFYGDFCELSRKETNAVLDRITGCYEYMAKYLPNPPRTLFTDDCIEKGLDFNAGGARYTWTQNPHSGLINVIDSLLAIRELVFRKKKFTPEQFLEKLTKEDPALFALLRQCPCYGIGSDEADSLAADYMTCVYSVYHEKQPGAFIDAHLLTEHQFLRYESEGSMIGPTPDGRRRGEPTCDSIASIRGKAVKGPTAMLSSAGRMPQNMADGISVLNLTLGKNFAGKTLRALVETYFGMGGIQLQVTVTSVEELRDAVAHPELHQDMIVRVGGYSDYFVRLSPALQQTVIERNIHELGG